MSALPPMSGRAFRAEFMPKQLRGYERDLRAAKKSGCEDPRVGVFDEDPYERCDFDEEED